MKIRTFGHFFNEGLRSVVRNKLMSVASIITVTAALFILGIFIALVMNVNNLTNTTISKIELEGYLKDEPTISMQHAMLSTLSSIKGVKSIEFVSKEQALINLKSMLGDNKQLAEGLEAQNPLPASYIIKVDNPSDVAYVSKQLNSMNVFYKIIDGKSIVDKIIKFTGFIKIASFVLMLLLGAISIALIVNTIKLTVFARKKEIGIMKYIGATDWYIRWPFIIEGITLGLIGGIVSILLITITYSYAINLISVNLRLFQMVTTSEVINNIGFLFCLIGMLIGGVGSGFSIRKFLVK
jgi:cell division transport system permease protein